MRLNKLFEGAPKIEIEHLMADSRIKSSKAIFFCIKGMSFDGHRFIAQAKANGAVAIVHSDDIIDYDPKLVYIKVDNVLATLNYVAAMFYENCTSNMNIFGVTGTNGKSTVATIIRNVLNNYEPCGYIGTMGIYYGDHIDDAMLMTPEIIPLHETLHNMYVEGMRDVAMEVSSIGLELHRVDSVDFDIAIFTNLTPDHLDFHGNMENYFKAKQKLFTSLDERKKAVINIDDAYGKRLMDSCNCEVITYSINQPATYQVKDIVLKANQTTFTIVNKGKEYYVETNLVANFNVYNLTAAIAALHEYGLEMEQIISQVKSMPQVLGRMENINEGQQFTVIVDFAHTPEGMEQVYQFARHITPSNKKLISVFGSAGQRDSKKRSVFGKISDKWCDLIILTEDDPRKETPKVIANQIAEGIKNKQWVFIESRFDAIRQAIEVANIGDTVVILGKGDETYIAYDYGKGIWMGDNVAARKCIREFYLESEENNSYEE